ncbi:rab-GTPase-TBC domain-containing protein [Amylostereum chailletii]|nr:rab-GTPase-TBC domain-containing protein [Amylostereum chailletii]
MTPVSFDESNHRGSTEVKSHKKTASSASARASFLLHRLEHQKDEKRGSIDGQHHLREEFNRLHQEVPVQENGVGANGIDWDFWGSVVSDYQAFAAENPDKLAREIERGIPDTLRGMVWQLMSASKDPEMERSYLQLLKEPSTHEKAITRDLGRTFPHHAFFTDGQGIGQENLFNVLKAYSLYDPQVGYCQGLPFIVAVLLLNMPDEEAFCLLVRLMHSYDLRGHFLPEMPKLQLRLVSDFPALNSPMFDRLIEELLPVLYLHFVRQGVKSSMFCSQWFLTLFSYRQLSRSFPLELVFRIFDNCLASGIEAIFGFSLALLQKNEEKILSLKFDELVAFLNQHIIDAYKVPTESADPSEPEAKVLYRVDELVQDAINLRITPFMLDAYAHEYADMIRERDAHAMEVDFLRSSNRNLSSQVNALEASLAQLNQEHVNILNELVQARLQHKELEGELVRYKLLYAESVHKTEDAMSSHRMSNSSSFGGSLFGSSPSSKRPSLQSMISGLTKSSS